MALALFLAGSIALLGIAWHVAYSFGPGLALAARNSVSPPEQSLVLQRKLWRYCLTTNYYNLAQLQAKRSVNMDSVFDLCRSEEDAFLERLDPRSADASHDIRTQQRASLARGLREELP